MPRELLLTAERQLTLEPYEEAPLAPNEVRANAIVSAISHGTEINLYRGTSPFHDKRFDVEKRLFVNDAEGVSYPMRLGYEWVGEVAAVGKDVYTYNVGDLIHLPLPHRETQTFIADEMVKVGVVGPLPDTLKPETAVFLASISIALQAIHDAHIKVGDHVVIFGMGVLGLLTVQLAKLNGAARIDAIDPIDARRKLAQELGATSVINPLETDVGFAIRIDSRGGDVAIEFSGTYGALHDAIRSVRMGGMVVAAGFYQGGASGLRLGEEWLHNRVNMVASTRSWGNVHRDYPLWDRPRLREASTKLLAEGYLVTDKLLSHTIPFDRAIEGYKLIDQGSVDVIKVVLKC